MGRRQGTSPALPPCTCGSGKPYAACCQPLHQGQAAASAEALMRSRYSAYTLGLEPYLLHTWHPSTRPTDLDLQASPQPKWLGLEIKARGLQDETHATVEFVARYRVQGRAHRLHETSRFEMENGEWRYVDGDIHGE